ncbi:MAG: GSCFA domain-containing protein [Saprospiraceae bacterium]
MEKQTFRTLVTPGNYPFNIDHTTKILSIGSCFASHIAKRLEQAKFSTYLNPFGIIYHPLAIAKGLTDLLDGKQIEATSLFLHQDLWHSFDFHSQFSHPDPTIALSQMNQSLALARSFLSEAKVLMVTLGTAGAFIHQKSERLVANCHKLPATDFKRQRLSVAEIRNSLSAAFSRLHQQQPDLKIILTLSPVRHIKDGLVENQRSKASLLLAIDHLCMDHPYIHYFPAYEMVIDDLRDYRFFEPDLIHPSKLAIDYIWGHFQAAFFSEESQQLVQRIRKMVQASLHRPFHPNTPSHQLFARQQLEGIQALKHAHPHLDFSKEENHFKTILAAI